MHVDTAPTPDTSAIKDLFHRTFGAGRGADRIHVIRAPGRVNLIGEHTDYNDGFVLPMAIEPEVRIVCRARDDGTVRLASTEFPGRIVEFSVQQKIVPNEPGSWDNYSRGVAAELLMAGIPLVGMDALISNTLPVGGGLSSSAAVEVGTGLALLTLAGMEMDPGRMALLCQKAEKEFAGANVGIMDQTIVAAGKAGHAMLLDCRDLTKRFVPVDPKELRVVIANTMHKHDLADAGTNEYAECRKQCEAGVNFFQKANPQVKALRDVTPADVQAAEGKLDDVIFRRCRHVVTENARTAEAAMELGHHNYELVGRLMVQSHESLRHDYEVTIPELDFLVEQATQVKGVYGARMTGGGFGGCIVALAQPRAVQELTDRLQRTFAEKFKVTPTVFVTTATPGASVLE